jgi:large subunit ribosomal protein L25
MTAKKEKTVLNIEKRKVIGREVKFLRRQGILPANIYGKKIKSLAVQLTAKSFLPVLKEVGETSLLELKVEGEEKTRPVLIHAVQFHPLSGEPLHADFYEVDLKEKVTTKVPVELIGESPAIKEKIGILIQPLSEVEVEALPADLPEKIEVDISGLKAIDDVVLVENIKVGEAIKILTEGQEVLAKIDALAKEEEVVVPVAEEGAEAEGEVKAEGEEGPAKETEEKKTEETKAE